MKVIFSCLIGMLFMATSVRAQSHDSLLMQDLERTFMPTVQMGYVFHQTDELSGGLITQTSLEYRDVTNFIFKLNYDALNSNMKVSYPLDSVTTYTGRTTMSDLIAGVGHRIDMKKHFLTNYIQGGVRFYGFPIFNQEAATINFDMNSRRVGLLRYSLGYEYMLAPKLFLSFEAHTGFILKPSDFWEDNQWSYGVTLGVSAPLF